MNVDLGEDTTDRGGRTWYIAKSRNASA